jgi:hypothetical protein
MLFAQSGQKKVYTPEEIGAVIQKVSQDNKKALDDLMAISLQNHPITMTQDITKVVIFGLIRSNQTAKLSAYLKKVDPGLTGFLNQKKLNKGCKACDGEGETETKCKRCTFGKCYNCKGLGYIEYKGIKGASVKGAEVKKEKSICNICHATGKCLKCKGEGKLKQDCSHCKQGMVLNKNSILKEMLKSIQNISIQTDSAVSIKSVNETKTSEELDSLFNQSVKKTVEQTDGNEQINPLEESEIQKAFKKAKAYIEDYELKNNKDICEDISLKYIDEVPALVLDLSDGYVQKVDSTKVREVSGFKKYWEDQAVIQGYDKEVATILMHNGLKVNDKFTLSEKYKRVK